MEVWKKALLLFGIVVGSLKVEVGRCCLMEKGMSEEGLGEVYMCSWWGHLHAGLQGLPGPPSVIPQTPDLQQAIVATSGCRACRSMVEIVGSVGGQAMACVVASRTHSLYHPDGGVPRGIIASASTSFPSSKPPRQGSPKSLGFRARIDTMNG